MGRQANYDRHEVLEKAMNLFWSKGYHATSLKDLENALDMRPGSIYAAFGSKEALFEEALNLYAERARNQLADLLANAPTPVAGLATHVRNLGAANHGGSSRACMLVKTLLETPDDDPVIRRAAERLLNDTETAFADAFRAAREGGMIGADAEPDRLAMRLQSEIFGLRAYAQRTDAEERIGRLAEDIARDLEELATNAGA